MKSTIRKMEENAKLMKDHVGNETKNITARMY